MLSFGSARVVTMGFVRRRIGDEIFEVVRVPDSLPAIALGQLFDYVSPVRIIGSPGIVRMEMRKLMNDRPDAGRISIELGQRKKLLAKVDHECRVILAPCRCLGRITGTTAHRLQASSRTAHYPAKQCIHRLVCLRVVPFSPTRFARHRLCSEDGAQKRTCRCRRRLAHGRNAHP